MDAPSGNPATVQRVDKYEIISHYERLRIDTAVVKFHIQMKRRLECCGTSSAGKFYITRKYI